MTPTRYDDLVVPAEEGTFRFIDPPFLLNAANVAVYPREISGFHLLESLRKRLGWTSFADRTLVDLGCGERFARTICNLGLPFGRYVGVDVNRELIAWFRANLDDARFTFVHFDVQNGYYNPAGSAAPGQDALAALDLPACDAVCMFSVITHQNPDEARLTFRQARRVVKNDGQMYFTASTDDTISTFSESDSGQPGALTHYNPAMLLDLVESSGWRVTAVHPRSPFQLTAFVCSPD
jgi:SAM-dependent methyltransferase